MLQTVVQERVIEIYLLFCRDHSDGVLVSDAKEMRLCGEWEKMVCHILHLS